MDIRQKTSQVVGRQTHTLDENSPGVHNLDGIQAVSYTRIRYTAGDDFKRAERQRIILQKMIQKLKTAGPVNGIKFWIRYCRKYQRI